MTKTERKRALLLEKVSRRYSKTGIMNSILIFQSIAFLIIDAVLFSIAANDDELYIMLPFHIFIMGFFSALMMFVTTSVIGDTTFVYGSANGNALRLSVNGSLTTGEFLCTLPFKAKDLMNLRLINFEKQFAYNVISTVIIEIALIAAESFGYTTYIGACGFSVIAMLVSQILLMASTLTQNIWLLSVFGASGMLITFGTFLCFGVISEEYSNAADFFDKFGFLKIFTGIPGIFILIIFSVAIAAVGEYYLKHKTAVSWHLEK